MSYSEFVRWLALREKNGPLGWGRMDHLVASICFWVWRMQVYDPDKEFSEVSSKDFLTKFGRQEEKKPKTVQDFISEKVMKTRIFVTALGGKILKNEEKEEQIDG